MKQIRLPLCAIIILLVSAPVYAQDNSLALSLQLKQNIQIAFDNYKMKDTISIESDLQEEIMENYYRTFMDLDPKEFGDEYIAIGLIQYYLTTEGIEDILHQWKMQTDSLDNVLSIGKCLYRNIYLGSENQIETTKVSESTVKTETDIPTTDSATVVDPLQRKMLRNKSAAEIRNHDRQFAQKLPPKNTERNEIAVRQRNMEVKKKETASLPQKTMVKKEEFSVKSNLNEFAIGKNDLKTIETKRLEAIVRLQNNLPTDKSNQHLYMLTSDTKNKYATLIINDDPEKLDADIYLNGKFINSLKKTKNGILVHSQQPYDFELKSMDSTYCKKTITLAPKERKTTRCMEN